MPEGVVHKRNVPGIRGTSHLPTVMGTKGVPSSTTTASKDMSDSPAAKAAKPTKATKATKERRFFDSSLGWFTAVANADKIGAICHERMQAKCQAGTLGATFLQLGWHTLNEFPGWNTPRGYRLTLEHDTKECAYDSTAYYGITLMHTRLHFINCYPGCAFKTSYAFEALCGGLFYPPAERWNDPQKLEMDKALARDIVGEKKAAIAESLTPDEKAELVGFKKGFDFALDMVAKVNPEEADPYSNWSDEEQKTKMTQVFTYDAAKMLKDDAPPKAYALLFEPDERPMLCYGFAHEVFLASGRDYTLAYTYADSAMHALWERNMADPSNKLGAQMEDPSTPLAERLAQIDAATAADKRKDAEFEREQETALAAKRAAKKAKVEAEASGSR